MLPLRHCGLCLVGNEVNAKTILIQGNFDNHMCLKVHIKCIEITYFRLCYPVCVHQITRYN